MQTVTVNAILVETATGRLANRRRPI